MPVIDAFRVPQVFGHNLPVDEANQRRTPNPQLFRRYVRQMERIQHAREDVRVNVRRGDLHLMPVVDELAALEHHFHIHIMQVVQHDEIRQVPRAQSRPCCSAGSSARRSGWRP